MLYANSLWPTTTTHKENCLLSNFSPRSRRKGDWTSCHSAQDQGIGHQSQRGMREIAERGHEAHSGAPSPGTDQTGVPLSELTCPNPQQCADVGWTPWRGGCELLLLTGFHWENCSRRRELSQLAASCQGKQHGKGLSSVKFKNPNSTVWV